MTLHKVHTKNIQSLCLEVYGIELSEDDIKSWTFEEYRNVVSVLQEMIDTQNTVGHMKRMHGEL